MSDMTTTDQAPGRGAGGWLRSGATLYTLKEDRDSCGRRAQVNDNWFLVQGPDAEAVAERVHAALAALTPVPVSGDGAVRADFPGDRFQGGLSLRDAALEIINWYERDGSVGTLGDYVADLRSALAAAPPAAGRQDQGARPGAGCFWGGGNDVISCATCGAEYAYAKGEERPSCPRAGEDGSGRDPDGSGSRPSDQAAAHPAPAGFDPSRKAADHLADAARELAGYASYAEIVGGISTNRSQIRKWCDAVFAAVRAFEEARDAV